MSSMSSDAAQEAFGQGLQRALLAAANYLSQQAALLSNQS